MCNGCRITYHGSLNDKDFIIDMSAICNGTAVTVHLSFEDKDFIRGTTNGRTVSVDIPSSLFEHMHQLH